MSNTRPTIDMERFGVPLHDRHPSTRTAARALNFDHLSGHLRSISQHCCELGARMVTDLKDGPELTTGLRKLREAKDCFVLQSVWDLEDLEVPPQ